MPSCVGLRSDIPGGKAGLSLIGDIGPGEGFHLSVWEAALKEERVGPVNGSVEHSVGIVLLSIHGKWERGTCAKESSIVIQSLVSLWMCQSIILVRWHADWYLWMSGKPKPPFSLGRVILSQLILGDLEAQIKFLQSFFISYEK